MRINWSQEMVDAELREASKRFGRRPSAGELVSIGKSHLASAIARYGGTVGVVERFNATQEKLGLPDRWTSAGHWGYKRGPQHHSWKGGVSTNSRGRVLIHVPDHPFPNYHPHRVFRYRLVVEKHLGRYLTPDEHVHHINGDHSDDRIENLKVMTKSEHARLHALERHKHGAFKRNKKVQNVVAL